EPGDCGRAQARGHGQGYRRGALVDRASAGSDRRHGRRRRVAALQVPGIGGRAHARRSSGSARHGEGGRLVIAAVVTPVDGAEVPVPMFTDEIAKCDVVDPAVLTAADVACLDLQAGIFGDTIWISLIKAVIILVFLLTSVLF